MAYVRRCLAVAARDNSGARVRALRPAVTDCKAVDISGLDGAAALEHLFCSTAPERRWRVLRPLAGCAPLRTLDLGEARKTRQLISTCCIRRRWTPHHHAQPEGIFHHQYGGGRWMEDRGAF